MSRLNRNPTFVRQESANKKERKTTLVSEEKCENEAVHGTASLHGTASSGNERAQARKSFMARRVVAENAREALVSMMEKEQRPAAASDGNDAAADVATAAAAKQRHKELVRAAGRAAVEESLLSKNGIKRKASEMTAEGIAAQWQAYAEVYGTNGMAAGGARSVLVGSKESDSHPAPSESAAAALAVAAIANDSLDVAAVVSETPPPINLPINLPSAPAAAAAASDPEGEREVRPLAIWDF